MFILFSAALTTTLIVMARKHYAKKMTREKIKQSAPQRSRF
jgi:hypothetical protein